MPKKEKFEEEKKKTKDIVQTIRKTKYKRTGKEAKFQVIELKGKAKKSRKGKYLKITEKDKKVHYYKIKEEKDVKNIKLWHSTFGKHRYQKYKSAKRYLKAISKRGTIELKLLKGLSEITTTKIPNLSEVGMYQIKRQLLKPMVNDQEILDIICHEENFKKLQHRVLYEIQIKDDDEQTLIDMVKGNISLGLLQTELRESGLGKGKIIESRSPILEYLRMKGYNTRTLQAGVINTITTKISFRKG